MPQISEENLKRLLRAETLLDALKACGVDNWEGYSEAIRMAFPEEDEDDDPTPAE